MISVIVPVKGDRRLGDCLAALAAQSDLRFPYEIIVVDDGPDAFVEGLAEQHGARYLVHADRGSYAARTRGAAAAQGDVLAFTDADCLPPPHWLATIGSLFADGKCAVLMGPSSATDHSVVSSWIQAVDEAHWKRAVGSDRSPFCDTRNLAVRRGVLSAVPIDPSFRYAGDVDLGIRLVARGITIRREPSLRVGHRHPRSLRGALRRGVRRGRGLAQLHAKHGAGVGSSGGRPLRIGGRDVKQPVLRLARRWRPLSVAVISLSLAPLMVALFVLARLPDGEVRGRPLFMIFERLTLLLGRVLD